MLLSESSCATELNQIFLLYQWQRSEELIKNASENAHEMLLDDKAPFPGQIKQFPNLAKTFRTLAEEGHDGFYKGRIAEAIVELVQSKGGVMELEDLAQHRSALVEPIKYTYGGEVTLYEVSHLSLSKSP
jgi:gamma-glutamyltranspeptidase / glutathione hydrolase